MSYKRDFFIFLLLAFGSNCVNPGIVETDHSVEGIWIQQASPALHSAGGRRLEFREGRFYVPEGSCRYEQIDRGLLRLICKAEDVRPLCANCRQLDLDAKCDVRFISRDHMQLRCPTITGPQYDYLRMR